MGGVVGVGSRLIILGFERGDLIIGGGIYIPPPIYKPKVLHR